MKDMNYVLYNEKPTDHVSHPSTGPMYPLTEGNTINHGYGQLVLIVAVLGGNHSGVVSKGACIATCAHTHGMYIHNGSIWT